MVFSIASALGLNESEGFSQVGRSLKHGERRVIGGGRVRVHTQSFEVESILVHRRRGQSNARRGSRRRRAEERRVTVM
jgi:hypothetical protein